MGPILKQSVIILKRISNQLINAKDGILYLVQKKIEIFNSSKDENEIYQLNTCMYGLIHYSFINYISFLDEYNNHFNSSEEEERKKLKPIKRNCKKYIQCVTEIFGNINQARNTVLAHGFRDEHIPLDNDAINKIFNRLLLHNNIEPFTQLSNTTVLIINDIGGK